MTEKIEGEAMIIHGGKIRKIKPVFLRISKDGKVKVVECQKIDNK